MAKAKILIVEDSEPQAAVTRGFLERNDYETVWAENGIAAIKAVKTTPFDLILLDFLLPDMNGDEVCRWLKFNSETKGIPIIMLTVKSSLQDKVSAIEAGADEYLPKPYNEVELNATIYAALRTKALQDELKQKNRQMEELLARVELVAITDPLTSLFNRRYFESVIEKELKAWKRYDQPLTCLMIDVDHFKRINDLYGHEAGDSVLRGIAELLKSHLREVDTAARWGGEEFIILLPRTEKHNAFEPASRILKAISDSRFELVPNERVTVSIGVACADRGTDTAAELIRVADSALYAAKEKGRNRIEFAQERTSRGQGSHLTSPS